MPASQFQPINPVTQTVFRQLDAPAGQSTAVRDGELANARTAGGAPAIVLPGAGLLLGMCCGVIDVDGNAAVNNVAVTVAGGAVAIDGAASYAITSPGQHVAFVFDGIQWRRAAGRQCINIGGTIVELATDAPAISQAVVAATVADAQQQVVPIVSGPSGWWGADFPSSKIWTPRPGAGPFATNGNLIVQGVAPSVGATLANGRAPANFNGSTQGLRSAGFAGPLIAGLASNLEPFSAAVFARADALAAPGAFYAVPPLICDDTTHWGLCLDSGGVTAGAWGGGTDQTPKIPVAIGDYFAAFFRYDGTTLFCNVATAAAFSSQQIARTVGPGVQRSAPTTQFIRLGVQGDNSARLTGDIYEALTWDRFLSAAEVASEVPYFNARFGKSLKAK